MKPKPLKGVTILDFTQLLQGPFATQMLGDMGADVIKIERPGSGDMMRSLLLFNKRVGDAESPCFLAWNRNKRSITVDLKHERSREILQRMSRTADVVVENFRPGVLDRLGFGYDDFRAWNRGIIYCSATGFGATGPYAARPGQDMIVQGLSGFLYLNGRRNDPPTPAGVGLADQFAAFHIVYGVLGALYARERTGRGDRVHVDLLRSMMANQMQEIMTYMNTDARLDRPTEAIAHPGNPAPYGIYETRDGYISIAMNPWKRIVSALGDESLGRYNEPDVLYENRDDVFRRIQNIIRGDTTDSWIERLLRWDIWCGPVRRYDEVVEDPQLHHMGVFVTYDHPTAGPVRTLAPAVTMESHELAVSVPPPLLGQHSREILAEFGYDDEEIQGLIDAGVVTEYDDSIPKVASQ